MAIPQADQIEELATKYTKPQLQRMAQLGQIDPTMAVMAGMMIDRIVQSNIKPPTTTVAQDVMAQQGLAGLPSTPEQAAMAGPAEAGLDALPVSEDMVPDEYAGGGIVAFARGELVEQDLRRIRGGKPKHPDEDMTIRLAKERGENPVRALELLYLETGGLSKPESAVSKKGAIGSMQIMPSTAMKPGYGVPSIFDLAKERGVEFKDRSESSAKELLKNKELNIDFGIRYRQAMENRFGSPYLAAAAYNAGPGAVTRAGGVPAFPETQEYVRRVGDKSAFSFFPSAQAAETPRAAAPEAPAATRPEPAPGSFAARQEAAAKKVIQARREQMGLDTSNVMPRSELVEQMTLPELQEYNRSGKVPDRLMGAVRGRDIGAVPIRPGSDIAGPSATFRAAPAVPPVPIPAVPPEGPPMAGIGAITDPETIQRLTGLPSGAVISEGAPVTLEDMAAAARRTKELPRDETVSPDFARYLFGGKKITPASPAMAAAAAAQRAQETAEDKTAPAAEEVSYQDLLNKLLGERESRLTSQREQDKNLALLAAGLGIMSGKSPYALQNIGAGALKGVEQYGESRKLARQEEADILTGRLGQYRYGEESRAREESRRLDQGMRLAASEEHKVRQELNKILGDITHSEHKKLQAQLKANPNFIDERAIASRNRILRAYKLDDLIEAEAPISSGTVLDYSSIVKPKK